jgi:hypothetical protein
MPLDFNEIIEDGAKIKAYIDQIRAFAASLQAEPKPSISQITDGIAEIIKSGGRLAEVIKADVQD